MARELTALKAKVGSRIRTRRKTLEISQEELAFQVSISPTYLSQIEDGKRNVSLDVLHHIAQALHLDLADLVKR